MSIGKPKIFCVLALDFDYRNSENSGMTPQDLLQHFGSQSAIAKALGCKQQTVFEWFEKGQVP